MSETDNLIDTLSKVIVGTVDDRLSSADFDKSSQGVVTAKAGDTYTIAVFGGNYNITTDQTFVVGQKVLVTAPQGNMKNLTVSPGNVGTMKTVRSGVQDVDDRLTDIEGDYNFAYDIIKKQTDGEMTIWYNTGEPTAKNYPAYQWTDDAKKGHIGDMYFDTKNNIAWQWEYKNNTYLWVEVSDSTITATLLRSSQAQDTADGKRRVFYSDKNHAPSPPYDVGDIWAQGSNGDLLRCIKARTIMESGSTADWALASKYTDDTVANEAKQELADFKNGEFTNLRKEYDTNFTVDNKSITGVASSILYGTKLSVGGQPTETAIGKNTSKISVLDENINMKVSYEDLTGDKNNKKVKEAVIDITKDQIDLAVKEDGVIGSQIKLTNESITSSVGELKEDLYGKDGSRDNPKDGSVVKQLKDEIESRVTEGDMTTAINQSAKDIKSTVVSKDEFTGKNLISTINQTSEAVTINASKINLDGDVLAINTDKITIKGNSIDTNLIKSGAIMNKIWSYDSNSPYSGGSFSFDNSVGYTELMFVFRGWYQEYSKTDKENPSDDDGYVWTHHVTYHYYTATNTMIVPLTLQKKVWYQSLFNYPKSYYSQEWDYYIHSSKGEEAQVDDSFKEGMLFDKSLTDIMRFFSVEIGSDNKVIVTFKNAIQAAKDSFLWISWETSKTQPSCVIPWIVYAIK